MQPRFTIVSAFFLLVLMQTAFAAEIEFPEGYTLVGDVKQIVSSGNMLEIGESLSSVVETLGEGDLEMLASGNFNGVPYSQALSLETYDYSGKVRLDENNNDETGVYLFWNDGDKLFDYSLTFDNGLRSEVIEGSATSIENYPIYILGKEYNLATVEVNNTAVKLVFSTGGITDTLAQGETATYTINGQDYEVTILVIGENGNGVTSTIFSVNGQVTNNLRKGQEDSLSDGMNIGVIDIIETSEYRESDPSSIVEFYITDSIIEISDSDITNNVVPATITVNYENAEDSIAHIIGSVNNTTLQLDKITYSLTVDAAFKSDIYLAEGEGVRAALDEPRDMLGDWDIVFLGIGTPIGREHNHVNGQPETTELRFDSEGDDQYYLTFTNILGNTFEIPFLFAGSALSRDSTFGDEEEAFIFTERDENNNGIPNIDSDYNIGIGDYFALTNIGGVSLADNGDDSYVLQFIDVDEDSQVAIFRTAGRVYEEDGIIHDEGDEILSAYTPPEPENALIDAPSRSAIGSINLGGFDFHYWLIKDATNGYRLSVDQDRSGALENNSVLDIVIQGGGVLTLSNASFAGLLVDAPGSSMFFATFTTDEDDTDNSQNQKTRIYFAETSDEIDIDFSSTNDGGSGDFFYDDDTDADTETALNRYGTWFMKTDNTDEADDLTIRYPDHQVEARVFVSSGEPTFVYPPAIATIALTTNWTSTTNSITLSAITDITARCVYQNVTNNVPVNEAFMENTNSTNHSQIINALVADTEYTFNIYCLHDNEESNITSIVARTQPEPVIEEPEPEPAPRRRGGGGGGGGAYRPRVQNQTNETNQTNTTNVAPVVPAVNDESNDESAAELSASEETTETDVTSTTPEIEPVSPLTGAVTSTVEETETTENTGFFSSIGNAFSSFFSWIGSIFS